MKPIGAVQAHGNTFEAYIKVAFPGSSNHNRSPTSHFDIESRFDKIKIPPLPTTIKTTQNNTICLADASRIFNMQVNFRLIVLKYKQNGKYKVPEILYEFEVTQNEWAKLKGQMPPQYVTDFHTELKKYKTADFSNARIFAKATKKKYETEFFSHIKLNPKIGSKDGQRRVQCSINLNSLLENISNVQKTLPQNGIFLYRNYTIGSVLSDKRK